MLASSVAAQFGYGEGRWSRPMREGLPERRSGFMFCRLLYTTVRSEPMGYGWSTDYPRSDQNFMTRLPQLTAAGISRWADGEVGTAVARPLDPILFQCPFLFASDVGTAGFTDPEAERLREYLLKGGFLWVDDFWGDAAWAQWAAQMRRIIPEYEIRDIPADHPFFSIYYQIPGVPQIPSIQFWGRSGGLTSERGAETAEAHLRAIFDERGRLLVLMSHNSDIADGFEREQDNEDFFYEFTARAYGIGINAVIFAMTH